MNLHQIKDPAKWLWVNVYGRTRSIGIHAYEVEEGTPPPLEQPGGIFARTPTRFVWAPYNLTTIFSQRIFKSPLCGKKSRILRATAEEPWRWGATNCAGCKAEARKRGIIVQACLEARTQSIVWAQAQAEYTEWLNAGRPPIVNQATTIIA